MVTGSGKPTSLRGLASILRMKNLVLTAFVVFCLAGISAAQQKPISQREYVQMLYSLDKEPSGKAEIIDALRRRGIDFVVTDGIRSLTRTKGRNDQELRSALDEAGRRKNDPEALKPPTAAEAVALISKTRQLTLDAVSEMPDFVVKQLIQRSAAYSGTGNFRNLDRLVVAVSYRASGEEEYKVLSLNGAIQNDPSAKRSYEEVGGTSSTGEFVTMLATIFRPESETKFDAVYTDTLRGRRVMMFDFSITADKAKQGLTCKDVLTQSTTTGMKGRLWIDTETSRILRVESEATEIPAGFPCPAARRTIDYDWTLIGEEKFLLPLLSDVRVSIRDKSRVFETRNLIRFREYQKYGTDVQVVGEDEAYIPDEPVNEKP